MNTTPLNLSTQWQKVSDDSKTVVLQLMSSDAGLLSDPDSSSYAGSLLM